MDIDKIKNFLINNLITIIFGAVAIVSIACSVIYVSLNKCEPCESCTIAFQEENIEEVESISTFKVDVKGAVKKPGVYELEANSTVNDAITLAGGLTSSGVTTNINLSKKLTDEMVIYVFTKTELKERESNNEVVCEIPKCECEEITICDDVTDSTTSQNTNSNKETSTKVSINTATLEELMTLDGIGETKAKSIIEYREQNGNFEKLEDIKNVSGIGDAAYEKIKDSITL